MLSTPDSSLPRSPAKAPTSPSRDRALIVTSDSERFLMLDVSHAQDPAAIRERIFTKLHIYTDEEQVQFDLPD
ncbi:hypothetical protein NP233_g12523 [Leucocoprinus birnbaumii]|uniref:Uncharacterized protein n=1 Tax=Leucocoprinus birnbaumii TaxID=56174 RepID=A0AAD5YPX5_9AGAR|nr:hypothetical protein NP233_g12523 [Leucocoprinus birnbaumii]